MTTISAPASAPSAPAPTGAGAVPEAARPATSAASATRGHSFDQHLERAECDAEPTEPSTSVDDAVADETSDPDAQATPTASPLDVVVMALAARTSVPVPAPVTATTPAPTSPTSPAPIDAAAAAALVMAAPTDALAATGLATTIPATTIPAAPGLDAEPVAATPVEPTSPSPVAEATGAPEAASSAPAAPPASLAEAVSTASPTPESPVDGSPSIPAATGTDALTAGDEQREAGAVPAPPPPTSGSSKAAAHAIDPAEVTLASTDVADTGAVTVVPEERSLGRTGGTPSEPGAASGATFADVAAAGRSTARAHQSDLPAADPTMNAAPAGDARPASTGPLRLPGLTMDLGDEGLGPLEVHARAGAGGLHLTLTAGDHDSVALLTSQRDDLRRELEANGASVGSLDIGHGDPSGDRSGGRARERDGSDGRTTRSDAFVTPAGIATPSLTTRRVGADPSAALDLMI